MREQEHIDASQDDELREGLKPDDLLSAVSDLLLLIRQYQSGPDRAYANDLAGRIIASLPASHHGAAARIVSKLPNPPEALLRQLAFLSHEAAEIVLLSRHVTDAILMEAATKGFEYRAIIARRPSLSEPVVNRLLFHEEVKIEMLVLPRQELPLSDNRAAWLIGRCEPDSALAALMVRRNDLSPRLALRLFWKVEGDHRQAILQKFDVNPAVTAKLFDKLLGRAGGEGRRPIDRVMALIARATPMATPPAAEAVQAAEKALAEFRRSTDTFHTARMASKVKISPELAQKIMDDVSGESFAVLCAALSVTPKGFRRLASINPAKRRGRPSYSQEDRTRMSQIFESLSQPSAIAILSYWDLDLLELAEKDARERLKLDMEGMKERLSQFGKEEAAAEPGSEPGAAPAPAPKKRRLFG